MKRRSAAYFPAALRQNPLDSLEFGCFSASLRRAFHRKKSSFINAKAALASGFFSNSVLRQLSKNAQVFPMFHDDFIDDADIERISRKVAFIT